MIKVRTDLFRAAAVCISREMTRYYLNGVYIEPHHEKGALLVGTDGRVLLCAHDDEAVCDKPAIVMPATVYMAERLWLDPHAPPRAEPEDDDDDWPGDRDDMVAPPAHLIIDDAGKLEAHPIRGTTSALIDGKFVNWRKTLQDIASDKAPPCLDGELLTRFTKVAGLIGRRGAVMPLNVGALPDSIPPFWREPEKQAA